MRRYCQHLLQKLSNNGGVDAATEQMKAKQYAEPFKADKRKVIALAIELDEMGKGLVDWKEVYYCKKGLYATFSSWHMHSIRSMMP